MYVARIVTIVLSYWVISIATVFLNKHLLGSGGSDDVDVSIFISLVQCCVTVVISAVTCAVCHAGGGEGAPPAFNYRLIFERNIAMMTFAYVGMLVTNNICLRLVGVAFYQVARSTTLAFTVLLAVVLLKERVSRRVVACCAIVVGGFTLGIGAEQVSGTLSVPGVVFGVSASVLVALNGVLTKQALDVVGRHAVLLTGYANAGAALLLLPLALASGQLQLVLQTNMLTRVTFVTPLLGSSVFGFLIGWISAVQINATSPVTHHISANTKAVLQTLIAVVAGGDTKSALWWLSVTIVFAGATLYAVVRTREAAAAATRHGDVETAATDTNS